MNTSLYNRLAKAGLREAAESLKDEVRQRRKAAGDNQATARQAADDAMSEAFKPILERWEKQQAAATQTLKDTKAKAIEAASPQQPEPPAPQLAGLPVNTNALADLLSTNYSEADPGKQLRDGLLWTVFEWMRVVKDTEAGPVVDIAAASTPPPNAFALFILATYALGSIDKRKELVTRALAFATKSHDPEDTNQGDDEEGFLDKIG